MGDNDTPDAGPTTVSRRTLAAGAAWSVPMIMSVSAAPAFAASGCSGPNFSQDQIATYDNTNPPQLGNAWTSPQNVEAADGTYASRAVTSGGSSPYMLTAYTFAFDAGSPVPAGSTIVSVQIDVRWYVADAAGGGTGPENGAWFQIDAIASQPSTTVGGQYLLTYNGSNWPIGSANAITTSYLLTGTLPTATVVRSPNFGARVGFGRQTGEEDYIAYVDFIRITVCYR